MYMLQYIMSKQHGVLGIIFAQWTIPERREMLLPGNAYTIVGLLQNNTI